MGDRSTLTARLKSLARAGLARTGFDLVRTPGALAWPHDFDTEMIATCQAAAPYTLTGVDRLAALISAVRHLQDRGVEGDVVECGVWRGGSMLAVARTLGERPGPERDLWLYDTFTRMPPPGERDFDIWGRHASTYFDGDVDPHDTDGYRYLPLDEVKAVIAATGFDPQRQHFVTGMVEDTIPDHVPARIALLRLDTDWYESTRHELEHLYPRMVDGGILIIDDYGQFTGARDAVDEYFATLDVAPYLHRIDFTGRLAVIRR